MPTHKREATVDDVSMFFGEPDRDSTHPSDIFLVAARDFAALVLAHVERPRERDLAIARIEEAVMHATAGVQRRWEEMRTEGWTGGPWPARKP